MNIKILDVKIDVVSKSEVLAKIKDLLNSNQQEQMVTTNPEFIVAAQKDNEFKNIINNSWLSVADGYGIQLAAKYLSIANGQRSFITKFLTGMKIAWWGIVKSKKLDVITDVITGTDLVPEIIKDIKRYKDIKIYLLGSYGNTPRLAAEKLKQKNPNLQIEYSIFEAENIIDKINNFKPDILFVALNHPRAQKWINENLHKMPSVKLAIGVGGAFDYISGKIKRAPQSWQRSFEWLFRLFKQPKRLKRILTAWPKFPWLVFRK